MHTHELDRNKNKAFFVAQWPRGLFELRRSTKIRSKRKQIWPFTQQLNQNVTNYKNSVGRLHQREALSVTFFARSDGNGAQRINQELRQIAANMGLKEDGSTRDVEVNANNEVVSYCIN